MDGMDGRCWIDGWLVVCIWAFGFGFALLVFCIRKMALGMMCICCITRLGGFVLCVVPFCMWV